MKPVDFCNFIVPAALHFFPKNMTSTNAIASIVSIGLQESGFLHRQQLIGTNRNWWQSINGPAVSFFQFEKIGIAEVLRHPSTRDMARSVLSKFGYPDDINTIHKALIHNDLLAAVFARLALYRVAEPLPDRNNPEEAWRQYKTIWRPGKPHPETWLKNFNEAWDVVNSLNLRNPQ